MYEDKYKNVQKTQLMRKSGLTNEVLLGDVFRRKCRYEGTKTHEKENCSHLHRAHTLGVRTPVAGAPILYR